MGREPPPYTVREYRLSLDVDYETLEFQGQVEIDLENVTTSVLLNAVDLSVESVRCGEVSLPFRSYPSEEGVLVEDIPGPRPTLEVHFRGRAAERGMQGLLKSRFGAYYMLSANCEPIGARRIFPCIDRPDRKAPIAFDLTVDVDDDAVANMPVVEQRTKGSRKRLTFLPTPPMATYLFHFSVGPFETLKGRASRVRLGVIAPIDRSASGAFALEHAAQILPAYEEYFGIAYPLPKLDLIDVPELSPGAMENWGAITFVERALLIDETTSSRLRRASLTTIAHEIAHQWFGNLVTMCWWSDIWLNESFATFMETKVLDQLHPDAQTIPDFLSAWISPALHGDSYPGTHPVSIEVQRPEEIADIFDEISYGKGAGVLRMIEGFIGPETFRSGVRAYLEKFRYGNASSTDLWSALETAHGQPLGPMLQAWIERPGLPVVAAHLENGKLVLEQSRFLSGVAESHEPPWPIPLSYRLNGESKRAVLAQAREEWPVAKVRSLHLNERAVGFYRVRYDPGLYDRLLMDWDELSVEEQWSIVQDLYAFLLEGSIDLDLYLRFVARAGSGTPIPPALEVARQYSGLDTHGEPPSLAFLLPGNAPYQDSLGSFLESRMEGIGWGSKAKDPEAVRTLRGVLAHSLVWNRPKTAEELATRFAEWDSLDPDLRQAVAVAYGRTGGLAEHAALVARLKGTEDESTAYLLERALTCFRAPEAIRGTIEMLTGDVVWRNHLARMIIWLGRHPDSRSAAWTWMADHGAALLGQFRGAGLSSWILGEVIPYVGIGREAEVGAVLKERPWPESERGVRKGLDVLHATSSLVRRLG